MEDYSINSSIQKSVNDSKGTPDEESGWTAYFEDSSNNDHHQQNIYSSSYSCSSSLISDAATTGAAWKVLSHNNHHVSACGSSPKIPKKLRFKKTRTKEVCEDDSLEDTASSPVNSPKVSDLKSNDMMNPRKREDQIHSSLGNKKAASSDQNYSKIQIEEDQNKMMNFDHGIKNDSTELKKRGMCLVPFSMLVNYLG
ncbi:hypothetical protein REPUB_Repub01dG0039500 [Reevesia pubescens]